MPKIRLDQDIIPLSEFRYALIGTYQKKIWTAFYTIRDERIRLISVRRAREQERRLYYES